MATVQKITSVLRKAGLVASQYEKGTFRSCWSEGFNIKRAQPWENCDFRVRYSFKRTIVDHRFVDDIGDVEQKMQVIFDLLKTAGFTVEYDDICKHVKVA